MLRPRVLSLVFAGIFAISAIGCDGGASGGTAGAGGEGGSGGTTSAGGSGGMAGAGGAGGGGGSGGSGGMSAGMTLTSPDITEGGMIPVEYTCAGKNISPQLDWTAGPAGTLSYALIFEDESNATIHWAIFDVSPDAAGLPPYVETTANPANVPGARQGLSYDNQSVGYLGPCPGGNLHTYKFTVMALDIATLPLVGSPGGASVKDVALEHDLASASLSAQSDVQPP
jgi:Raf kinase inhibitor-like YbhB/YbcL family protein